MAGRIKDITIEISGDTTGLDKVLKSVNSSTTHLSNEGISILENTSVIGLPVLQKLKDVLEQLKDGKGEE